MRTVCTYILCILQIESNSVIDVIRTVDIHLVKNIIPFRIIGPQCPVNGTNYFQTPYENYVLPHREQFYRIHPFYLRQQSLINIQVKTIYIISDISLYKMELSKTI